MNGMLGLKAVAERIGRRPGTVSKWRHLGKLPEPDSHRANGRPLWATKTVDVWWETAKDELGPPRSPSGPDPFWQIEIADD